MISQGNTINNNIIYLICSTIEHFLPELFWIQWNIIYSLHKRKICINVLKITSGSNVWYPKRNIFRLIPTKNNNKSTLCTTCVTNTYHALFIVNPCILKRFPSATTYHIFITVKQLLFIEKKKTGSNTYTHVSYFLLSCRSKRETNLQHWFIRFSLIAFIFYIIRRYSYTTQEVIDKATLSTEHVTIICYL